MTAQTSVHWKDELRPFIPLLVGQGKLARHLSYYLSKQSIPFKHWPHSRNLARDFTASELKPLLSEVTAVWILVSDGAIQTLSSQLKELAPNLPQIHSSAATTVPGALTLHPLQTFGPELYEHSVYQEVPFVFVKEEWAPVDSLKQTICKAFPNPTYEIAQAERARYHAYCVMMSNFPQLLWSAVEQEAEAHLKTSHALFTPILKQSVSNFIQSEAAAVTGPLVRGDLATIEKHKLALSQSRLLPLYENFVNQFSKTPTQKETL